VTKPVHQVVIHPSAIAGVAAMTLFSDHSFPRHSHDQYGIGVMTSGAQRSWSIIGQVESAAGDVIMLNPGEMHDGRPADRSARGWKILYFDPTLIARELTDEIIDGEFLIQPVARDSRLSRQVLRLFAQVERPVTDHLAAEESLVACLMHVMHKHRVGRARTICASPSVDMAIRRLDAAPEAATSLAELAALSGVSRFQLLRGFAREVGTTPHAYLIQRRVRLARRHLAGGKSPSEAATLAGFADQSHMTRAFVRQFGVTPARYKAAIS
jgi:AraC-like DNA-binding protein